MNNQEPIPDPILTFIPNPSCQACGKPITSEIFYTDQRMRRCSDCYALYIKNKFGQGNTNPDNYPVA